MILIGDVHGKFSQLRQILNHYKSEDICQLGDLGVGFPNHPYPTSLEHTFGFIRGNHDSPKECKQHPNYLGDFGYHEKNKMFFLSGAWSIDWQYRTVNRDWWKDEELSYGQLSEAAALYVEKKPEIVISHDCPDEVAFRVLKGANKIKTNTSSALQAMFEQHIPKVWYFGHYHCSYQETINGCQFQCLNELETCEIPNIKW